MFWKFKPEKKIEENIPIGKPEALEKETLPAVEVENKVVWVNPDFPELPFKLPTPEELEKAEKEGKEISTKLGLFLTPEEKGDFNVEVRAHHWRSGLIGRVIFKDKQGRFYRDVDAKGVGHIDIEFDIESDSSLKVIPPKPMSEKTWGIFDLNQAYKDQAMAEEFLGKGIRTYRTAAIIELKEIIDKDGNKVKINEAKEKGLLRKDDRPAIGIRAYGTKFRIQDAVRDSLVSLGGEESVDDARALVASELGVNLSKFSNEKYLKWMAETVAKNIALMHKKGYSHTYLTDHNITLDARIIDLNSVKPIKSVSDAAGDLLDAKKTLKQLSIAIKCDDKINVEEIMDKVYKETLEQ